MFGFYTMEPRYIIVISLAAARKSNYIDKVFMQA